MSEDSDENSLVGILILSDLHFNHQEKYSYDSDAYSRHKICLDSVLRKLETMPDEWKIDCIAITGDVGYQGLPEDYTQAKGWLTELNHGLSVDPHDVVICLY